MNSLRLYQYIITLCLIFSLSSCGFHLRGSGETIAINADSVYITSLAANEITNEIKTQLEFQGVKTPDSIDDGRYILNLSNELRDKKILTVSSATGKVQEYELVFSVVMSISDKNGSNLSEEQTISASRDLFFDENAVLALSDEERLIFEELRRQVANSVLRRLQAVTR